MTARLHAATMLVGTVVLLAFVLGKRTSEGGLSLPLQAAMILFAAAIVIIVCLTRTNPITLTARAAIFTRAIWLFTREILRGAWARRGRWRECLLRARSEV